VEILLRHVMSAAEPLAVWGAGFYAMTIAAFALYIGIALMSVLFTDDLRKAEIRYWVLHDLLELFRELLRLFRLGGRR
jgi:hypothetical protein